jgi:ketosteroid isomerase-like protein
MKNTIILLLVLICTTSCETKKKSKLELEAEVFKSEEDFKNLSQTQGISEAFYTFADDNAVIKRENDSLIYGKESIKKYYSNPKFVKASVTWKPDFIEVSNDGTLAYTYGKYIWTVSDSLGKKTDFRGIFHTVWKKQKDGSWKYVWD